MRKAKKRKIAVSIISCFLICGISLLLFGNFYVDVERFDISSDNIPDSFNNYLIAQISDYHNRNSVLVDKQILNSLQKEQPDIIVITGDLIDCNNLDVDKALAFVGKLCQIAPVYFVTGNHEANISLHNFTAFRNLLNGITGLGATVLRNESVEISNETGDKFNLCGIHDPYFYGGYEQVFQRSEVLCDELDMISEDFNVLLAHHPETLRVYSEYNADLVFAGHAHGGQVTLFGRAIVAPDQVNFPPYDEGLYKMDNTQLILSRGIGYSSFPIRVFCNPHLVYAEFKTE